jgi:hypothetical protein
MANGNSTALIQSGFDAFTNLYDTKLTWPTGVGIDLATLNQATINVRALDFSPPELVRGQYKVKYKIIELPRLNAEITGPREFVLKFRIDAAFNLHKNLLRWKHYWTDPSGEGNLAFQSINPDGSTSNGYGTLIVSAYNATTSSDAISDPLTPADPSTTAEIWTFYDVVCVEAGKPQFSREGSNAITIDAKFIFGRCIEPGQSTTSATATDTPVVGV